MPEPIISISGLRGIVGSELTPIVASNFAAAFCSQAPDGSIAIARDGRASGPMFADAISAAIVGHGRKCLDLSFANPSLLAPSKFPLATIPPLTTA
jgi:phosphomannomutase